MLGNRPVQGQHWQLVTYFHCIRPPCPRTAPALPRPPAPALGRGRGSGAPGRGGGRAGGLRARAGKPRSRLPTPALRRGRWREGAAAAAATVTGPTRAQLRGASVRSTSKVGGGIRPPQAPAPGGAGPGTAEQEQRQSKAVQEKTAGACGETQGARGSGAASSSGHCRRRRPAPPLPRSLTSLRHRREPGVIHTLQPRTLRQPRPPPP